jgi:hypothetical protein
MNWQQIVILVIFAYLILIVPIQQKFQRRPRSEFPTRWEIFGEWVGNVFIFSLLLAGGYWSAR